MLRTMPSKAIELASFDLYKKVLGAALSGGRKRDHPGGLATGLAGALAGAPPPGCSFGFCSN